MGIVLTEMSTAGADEQELMRKLVEALNEMRDALVTLSLELGDFQFDEAMASKNNANPENNAARINLGACPLELMQKQTGQVRDD